MNKLRPYLLGSLLLLAHTLSSAQGVGIGIATPNASAILDLTSSSRGMLIPRMTEAKKVAIPSPVEGLFIFQTDSATIAPYAGQPSTFWYYNGAMWLPLIAASNGWLLSGNTGTNTASNFLGTADNVDLQVKTNGTNRIRTLAANGYVGIGTTTPTERLTVRDGNMLINNGDNTAYAFRFQEPSSGGSNITSLKARAHYGNVDIPYVLPVSDGNARNVLTNDGAGNLYWTPNCSTADYLTTSLTTFSGHLDSLVIGDDYTFYRICATANWNIRGITGGRNGRFIVLANVCNTQIGLEQENTAASAEQRIITGGGTVFAFSYNEAVLLYYDGASSRWRICGKTP